MIFADERQTRVGDKGRGRGYLESADGVEEREEVIFDQLADLEGYRGRYVSDILKRKGLDMGIE